MFCHYAILSCVTCVTEVYANLTKKQQNRICSRTSVKNNLDSDIYRFGRGKRTTDALQRRSGGITLRYTQVHHETKE